jgi:Cadherin domain
VKLILREKLNREVVAEHRIQMYAIDGGAPQAKTGSTMLIVNVLDINDNRPKFTNNAYDITVAENTPPGTVVLQVAATDGDTGNNGLVEYSFTTSTLNSAAGRLFTIDNTTGNIVIKVNQRPQLFGTDKDHVHSSFFNSDIMRQTAGFMVKRANGSKLAETEISGRNAQSRTVSNNFNSAALTR